MGNIYKFISLTIILITGLIMKPYAVSAAVIDLPRTGQTKCYDSAGVEIYCAGAGQDAEFQAGAVWPEARFTDNGDQTITDKLTGLIWTKDANAPGPSECATGSAKTWQGALDYAACLNTNNYLGHTDWRLPNVNELRSLVNYSQSNSATWRNEVAFTNTQGTYYWSSSTHKLFTNEAWGVEFLTGSERSLGKTNTYYVQCVRGGQCVAPENSAICIPKTGQTISYAAGDDGSLQVGAAWPNPRFTDNGDQTVTDNLTGLIWTKDANAPGPVECTPGIAKTWQGALDYAECLNINNYLGHNDWRLPNVYEIRSLMNYGHSDTTAWLTSQGFSSIQLWYYWSSTTSTGYLYPRFAINSYFQYEAYTGLGYKTYVNGAAWCVRSGQVNPNLTVFSPNGGEIISKGQQYSVTWSLYKITGAVQIDLYKGSSNVLQLAASAPNTGSFTFTMPNTLANGNDYRIEITALSGSVSDFSDANFSIVTPTLLVTYPNGGQNLQKDLNYFNKQYTVTWNSSYINDNIQIDLYKGDINVLQIAASASNTGSYTFNMPHNLSDGNDYRIGISALNGTVYDFSDLPFTISSPVFDAARFAKLGVLGEILSADAVWETGLRLVRDNNNGLIWEIKSPVSIDVNYIGNFYSLCNVSDYIQQLSAATYGGRPQWFLPNNAALITSWKAYLGESCDLYGYWETTDGNHGISDISSSSCPLTTGEISKYNELQRQEMIYVLCMLNANQGGQCSPADYCTQPFPVRGFSYAGVGPVLIAPTMNVSLPPSSDLVLTWEPVINAVSYELMVDNNTGFGSPEIHNVDYGGTTYIATNFLPDNVYYWKVRARLSFGVYTPWSDAWQFTYQLPVSTGPVWVPLYRAYNSTIKDHYYTTSASERDMAVFMSGYKYEKIEGYVSDRKFNDPNCGYLFHLYNSTSNVHFYTSNEVEKDNKIIEGFAYQGIAGFLYTKLTEWTAPLYHLEQTTNSDHFYTISKFEYNNAINTWDFWDRGIVGYVGSNIANNRPQGNFLGIDTATGNYSTPAFTDLSLNGVGPNLNFTRYYNSNNNAESVLGPGWSFNYDTYILETAGGNVRVIWGNAKESFFLNDGNGNFTPAPGNFDSIVKIDDGMSYGYDLTTKDQTHYVFYRYSVTPPSGSDFLPSILLVNIKDKNGNILALNRYSSDGVVLSATDATGRMLTFEYTMVPLDNGNVTRMTKVNDPSINRNIEFTYDQNGNLETFKDARGNYTFYSYNADQLLSGITFPEGNAVTVAYDTQHKVMGITNGGITTGFDYSSGTAVITPAGTTTYAHDKYRAIGVTDAASKSVSINYAAGNVFTLPQSVTDKNSHTSSFLYDNVGNVTETTNALTQKSTYIYDAKNNLTSVTDPRGNTTTYTYDEKGNLLTMRKPLGGTTTYTYYSNGLVNTIEDPSGHKITYTYDAKGNPTRIMDNALSTYVDFTYDNAGRLLSKTDQLLRTTSYTYDANGNMIQVQDAKGQIATYTYDMNNRLVSVKDPKGQTTGKTTSYTYNALNLLSTETDPVMKMYQYTYNENGNIGTITDPDGNLMSYVYDSNNRLTSIKHNNITKVSYSYDFNGNLTTMMDENGVTNFTYDSLNRLVSYSNSFVGKSVGYEYDAAGNRIRIIYPENKQVVYGYDADSRLATVTDWLAGVTTYSYNGAGILQAVINPNGTSINYTYDSASRLTGLANKKSDNSIISDYVYTLNAVGNPTQIVKNEPLVVAIPPVSISASYDDANRMISSAGISYTYDSKGNLLNTSNGSIYNFDYLNRLTQTTINGKTLQYLYDGFGNRIARTKSGIQSKYLLDLNGEMSQVLAETDTAGNISNYYVYGLGLISRITLTSERFVYHFDHIGNSIAVTDSTQNIVEQYAYDEFGKASSTGAYANPFRYVGKYGVIDEGNGLLFMRARYYDAENGRFVSKDPLDFDGGDLNLYGYVKNNSVNRHDPSGLTDERVLKALRSQQQMSEILYWEEESAFEKAYADILEASADAFMSLSPSALMSAVYNSYKAYDGIKQRDKERTTMALISVGFAGLGKLAGITANSAGYAKEQVNIIKNTIKLIPYSWKYPKAFSQLK